MYDKVLPPFASVSDGKTLNIRSFQLPKCSPLNLEVARASSVHTDAEFAAELIANRLRSHGRTWRKRPMELPCSVVARSSNPGVLLAQALGKQLDSSFEAPVSRGLRFANCHLRVLLRNDNCREQRCESESNFC